MCTGVDISKDGRAVMKHSESWIGYPEVIDEEDDVLYFYIATTSAETS